MYKQYRIYNNDYTTDEATKFLGNILDVKPNKIHIVNYYSTEYGEYILDVYALGSILDVRIAFNDLSYTITIEDKGI